MVTQPEAASVVDETLGNESGLPIAEHATDRAGAGRVNLALFDLAGKPFSPPIRDLGGITLCHTATKAAMAVRYPHAGPRLTRKANADLVGEHGYDVLRLAASFTFGQGAVSLVVAKLSAPAGKGGEAEFAVAAATVAPSQQHLPLRETISRECAIGEVLNLAGRRQTTASPRPKPARRQPSGPLPRSPDPAGFPEPQTPEPRHRRRRRRRRTTAKAQRRLPKGNQQSLRKSCDRRQSHSPQRP